MEGKRWKLYLFIYMPWKTNHFFISVLSWRRAREARVAVSPFSSFNFLSKQWAVEVRYFWAKHCTLNQCWSVESINCIIVKGISKSKFSKSGTFSVQSSWSAQIGFNLKSSTFLSFESNLTSSSCMRSAELNGFSITAAQQSSQGISFSEFLEFFNRLDSFEVSELSRSQASFDISFDSLLSCNAISSVSPVSRFGICKVRLSFSSHETHSRLISFTTSSVSFVSLWVNHVSQSTDLVGDTSGFIVVVLANSFKWRRVFIFSWVKLFLELGIIFLLFLQEFIDLSKELSTFFFELSLLSFSENDLFLDFVKIAFLNSNDFTKHLGSLFKLLLFIEVLSSSDWDGSFFKTSSTFDFDFLKSFSLGCTFFPSSEFNVSKSRLVLCTRQVSVQVIVFLSKSFKFVELFGSESLVLFDFILDFSLFNVERLAQVVVFSLVDLTLFQVLGLS